jgi:hypothetical protein
MSACRVGQLAFVGAVLGKSTAVSDVPTVGGKSFIWSPHCSGLEVELEVEP